MSEFPPEKAVNNHTKMPTQAFSDNNDDISHDTSTQAMVEKTDISTKQHEVTTIKTMQDLNQQKDQQQGEIKTCIDKNYSIG